MSFVILDWAGHHTVSYVTANIWCSLTNRRSPMSSVATTFHFKLNNVEVSTHEPILTGRQIKALVPGLDPNDLLELRKGNRKTPIRDDEEVRIENGLHFITYPGGTDS
jgi:hypothetical protein